MGKGRPLNKALRSKVTPSGRWAPPANNRAVCMGDALKGKSGGGRSGVRRRFIEASPGCKIKG